MHALVAQWIEHLLAEQKVRRSKSPRGRLDTAHEKMSGFIL